MIKVNGTLTDKKNRGNKLFVETRKVTIQASESDVIRSVMSSNGITVDILLDLAIEKFMTASGLPKNTTFDMKDGTWIDRDNRVVRRMTEDETKFMWSVVDAKLASKK